MALAVKKFKKTSEICCRGLDIWVTGIVQAWPKTTTAMGDSGTKKNFSEQLVAGVL